MTYSAAQIHNDTAMPGDSLPSGKESVSKAPPLSFFLILRSTSDRSEVVHRLQDVEVVFAQQSPPNARLPKSRASHNCLCMYFTALRETVRPLRPKLPRCVSARFRFC